jgi:ubiquinone/menaquinone biosynthesis C-methylase UbiE
MRTADNSTSRWTRPYSSRLLPWLLDIVMRRDMFLPYRRRALAGARGRVLEIGIGSGVNLSLYTDQAREVVGLDPSEPLLARARRAAPRSLRIALIQGSAEELPFRSGLFDSVVSTWTLCSIPDVARALEEVRRVLAPDGRLIFVEHGRTPEARLARWQHRLTPLWKRVAGGCHLDRDPADLLSRAGFHMERLDTGYMRGPRVMTYMYEGVGRAGA